MANELLSEVESLKVYNDVLEGQIAQQKALLQQKNEELTELQAALKAIQAKLLLREKMASLGELTAGIAHEIQNPLNFVNNFSEVCIELIDELKEGPLTHLAIIDREEADMILDDLTQNLSKIAHHGKRADSIVKSMLHHSRASSGQKEATDVNVLADEYLRLAYHGLRAKDKTFNAHLVTAFDPHLGKVDVVAQDIGRVLLNLFTNAFYAVQEKQKSCLANQQPYQPTVSVSTRRLSPKQIEIRVRDNGTGIPASVKQKIYQPFFTTKPTGQGTGLGLSLSYDIVTKGHGGSMEVETEDNAFTQFIVKLPV